METPRCPLCNSADTSSTGLVRLANGGVAEGRRCGHCGDTWAVDDDGLDTDAGNETAGGESGI